MHPVYSPMTFGHLENTGVGFEGRESLGSSADVRQMGDTVGSAGLRGPSPEVFNDDVHGQIFTLCCCCCCFSCYIFIQNPDETRTRHKQELWTPAEPQSNSLTLDGRWASTKGWQSPLKNCGIAVAEVILNLEERGIVLPPGAKSGVFVWHYF